MSPNGNTCASFNCRGNYCCTDSSCTTSCDSTGRCASSTARDAAGRLAEAAVARVGGAEGSRRGARRTSLSDSGGGTSDARA